MEKMITTAKDLSIVFMLLLWIVFPLPLSAKVTGTCSNCHTMHYSQNGTQLSTWGSSGPYEYLAVDDCVGCHSAADATTWKDAVTGAPIVWNQSEPSFNTQKGLAGGNFYWVGAGDDTKGHNVYGIASQDSNLTTAPGRNINGCADGCHDTLAAPPSGENYFKGGCQGCHVFTYHHDDNEVYRFLKGHGFPPQFPGTPLSSDRKDITTYPDYVTGIEDDDWEQETTTDHNFYKGTNVSYSSSGTGLSNYHSITAFCAGCHRIFHEEMGSGSPWLRHPSDVALPTTGEYGAYDPVNNYSAEAPVAWLNPASPATGEAVVMCLSCHRAHGSDQPDMLRWDYNAMIAGGGGSGGCFTCHTQKN